MLAGAMPLESRRHLISAQKLVSQLCGNRHVLYGSRLAAMEAGTLIGSRYGSADADMASLKATSLSTSAIV